MVVKDRKVISDGADLVHGGLIEVCEMSILAIPPMFEKRKPQEFDSRAQTVKEGNVFGSPCTDL